MLSLREYTKEDASIIVSWLTDERMFHRWCANQFSHFPITAEELHSYYETSKQQNPFGFVPLVAYDDEGVTGQLFVRFLDEQKHTARLGFVLVDSKRRGQGLGRELIEVTLQYILSNFESEIVTLGVFEDNISAMRCYQSVGFLPSAKDEETIYNILGEEWKCLEMQICIDN